MTDMPLLPYFSTCCVAYCISLVLTWSTIYNISQTVNGIQLNCSTPCCKDNNNDNLSVLDWWQHPTANYAASYGRSIWSQVSQSVASQADSDAAASDYTHHVWWHCEQEDIRLCVCNDQPWAGCWLSSSIQVSSHHRHDGRMATSFEWAGFCHSTIFFLNCCQWEYYIHLIYAPFTLKIMFVNWAWNMWIL